MIWTRALVCALVAAWLAPAAAGAHDVWMEPSDFLPAPGSTVAVRLRLGEGFAGDPVPRNDARLVRFVAVGPPGELPVGGAHGGEPAGRVRLPQPGLWVVGYRNRPARLELAAAKFESYLVEEGLETVVAERARRGESRRPGRERYARCVKALLAVGGSASGGPDRRLGFDLELLVEEDPYSLRPGAELPVRLLFGGEPLAGALVVGLAAAAPGERQAARTDAGGRARLRLGRGGPWLLKAVHMVRAGDAEADWESYWASTTFAVSAREAE